MLTLREATAALLITCATAFAAAASAQTYNLAQDWSPTDNPNGPWSYLRGSTLLPYQPTTCCGLPVTTSFAPSHVPGSFLPVFWRPGSAGSDVFVHSYDPFNGGAFIGEAVLAWTAPSAGVVDISGHFYYGQLPQQRSNDIIIRNGTTVLGSQTVSYLNYFDSSHPWNFSFGGVAVDTGDIISVTFQRTPAFSSGSGVGGNVQISLVPEPTTALMLVAGLVAVVITRKVKSQTAGGDA
jgi:hypothetical protein